MLDLLNSETHEATDIVFNDYSLSIKIAFKYWHLVYKRNMV